MRPTAPVGPSAAALNAHHDARTATVPALQAHSLHVRRGQGNRQQWQPALQALQLHQLLSRHTLRGQPLNMYTWRP